MRMIWGLSTRVEDFAGGRETARETEDDARRLTDVI